VNFRQLILLFRVSVLLGIGYAIVENLATKKFKDAPIHVILAARDKKRGEEALEAIHKAGMSKQATLSCEST